MSAARVRLPILALLCVPGGRLAGADQAIRILTPPPDATIASAFVAVTASVPPRSCWRVRLDGADVSKACAAADGRLHRVIQAASGSHEIGIRSVDNPADEAVVHAAHGAVGSGAAEVRRIEQLRPGGIELATKASPTSSISPRPAKVD